MPTIWALGDLHLSFGTPNKSMDVFGPSWEEHPQKIKAGWKKIVSNEDLVLIPGDISWATKISEAMPDLEWIDALPGKKVMIRGNHDYWWPSLKKLTEILPPSITALHNNSMVWEGIAIGGARLWDTPEYRFSSYIVKVENPVAKTVKKDQKIIDEENSKIFAREINRLKLSLSTIDTNCKKRIVMTHYPPLSADLENSQASQILEQHQIDACVFGHLHSVRPNSLPFGKKEGVQYLLTSCDYIDFTPAKIMQL